MILKLFKKQHVHNFDINLYNIQMENDTSFLITQCKCGKTNIIRASNKSEYYKNFVKLVN